MDKKSYLQICVMSMTQKPCICVVLLTRRYGAQCHVTDTDRNKVCRVNDTYNHKARRVTDTGNSVHVSR